MKFGMGCKERTKNMKKIATFIGTAVLVASAVCGIVYLVMRLMGKTFHMKTVISSGDSECGSFDDYDDEDDEDCGCGHTHDDYDEDEEKDEGIPVSDN